MNKNEQSANRRSLLRLGGLLAAGAAVGCRSTSKAQEPIVGRPATKASISGAKIMATSTANTMPSAVPSLPARPRKTRNPTKAP